MQKEKQASEQIYIILFSNLIALDPEDRKMELTKDEHDLVNIHAKDKVKYWHWMEDVRIKMIPKTHDILKAEVLAEIDGRFTYIHFHGYYKRNDLWLKKGKDIITLQEFLSVAYPASELGRKSNQKDTLDLMVDMWKQEADLKSIFVVSDQIDGFEKLRRTNLSFGQPCLFDNAERSVDQNSQREVIPDRPKFGKDATNFGLCDVSSTQINNLVVLSDTKSQQSWMLRNSTPEDEEMDDMCSFQDQISCY